MMQRFYLPAKTIRRKNAYIVYLKAGDNIADFLKLCNASQALFDFEDSRIQRDFYNNLKRLDNCELANEMKALKAGKKQLDYIYALEPGMMRSGELLTLDFTDYHKTESVSTLSQILEKEVPQKYYLSEELVARIKWKESQD